MVIEQAIRIILSRLRQVAREAVSRNRLVKQHPSLRGNLPVGVFVDKASQLGPNCILEERARVYASTLGEHVNLGKNTEVRSSTIGSFCSIGINSSVVHAEVGAHSYFTGNAFLQLTAVGKFCSIATNFVCGYGNHPVNMLSTHPAFLSRWTMPGGISFVNSNYYPEAMPPSSIGNDVWCGANVFVKAGVTIGDGAVLAAGAIVTQDVAPYTIVGGVPAKPIRVRFSEEDVAILLELQWWNWPVETLREAAPLVRRGDAQALKKWYAQRLA